MTMQLAPTNLQKTEPEEDNEAEVAAPAPKRQTGLTLAGLQFFIADINRKSILWHEIGSQSFDSEVRDIQEAPLSEALGLLTPEDKRTILRLVQGAIREGKAGPFDVGGGPDHRIPGIPLVAYRYQVSDGRMLAICFPSIGEDDANPGNIALGLAPILQHFVASTNRIVFLVDNFGYIRFVSEGFVQGFGINDAKLILGRNIAHVQKRVGRTIVSLCLGSLTRRASASGRGKFLLASGDTLELAYNAMHFRIAGSFGGVLFSAGQVGGDTDFAKVFNLASAPMIVVNTQNRMILAANQSAMKTYHLTTEIMDTQPITETLLHPKSYSQLLQTAQQGADVPQSVVVNSLNGQSKKKRLKAVLMDEDKAPKLLLEARS